MEPTVKIKRIYVIENKDGQYMSYDKDFSTGVSNAMKWNNRDGADAFLDAAQFPGSVFEGCVVNEYKQTK